MDVLKIKDELNELEVLLSVAKGGTARSFLQSAHKELLEKLKTAENEQKKKESEKQKKKKESKLEEPWSEEEHLAFLEALMSYGPKNPEAISTHIATKNVPQVEKYLENLFEEQKSRHYERLMTYYWDQSSTFVNVHITLPNIKTLTPRNLILILYPTSLHLKIHDLDNKNYSLDIPNLYGQISPPRSFYEKNVDLIVIKLKKHSPFAWLKLESPNKPDGSFFGKKKPEFVMVDGEMKLEEPAGYGLDRDMSFVDVLRQFYQEGDNDLKKFLLQSWEETIDTVGVGLEFLSTSNDNE
eukprot:TRINITY_DN4997_c0_g5_i1.p1 TRINITY_DN4997_c0_g5~~TRINITY_DN4997_c0_g5_i1.p1  ORF type:complete len:297 (+),score=69.82 TRINITY_DN4997_c0_g5_i1:64-954(+)